MERPAARQFGGDQGGDSADAYHVGEYLAAVVPEPAASRAFDSSGRSTTRRRCGRRVEGLACLANNHTRRAGLLARRNGLWDTRSGKLGLAPFAQDGGLRLGSGATACRDSHLLQARIMSSGTWKDEANTTPFSSFAPGAPSATGTTYWQRRCR